MSYDSHGWASIGLGAGGIPRSSIAGILEGWISIQQVAIGYRAAGTTQLWGEDRSDQSLLVGVRTTKSGNFMLAAAGVGRSFSSNYCECAPSARPDRLGVAYAFESHANYVFVGAGLSLFGIVSTPDHNYAALALTLDLGGFGR